MILVDSSAWVEYFRGSGSSADLRVRELLTRHDDLAVSEVVLAELLSVPTDEATVGEVRSFLLGLRMLRLRGLDDFEEAARLRRLCRRGGETVRGIADCLVAVSAISAGAALLHADRDFDILARHTPLEVVPLDD